MRLLLLGSPGTPGDPIERWHDDAYLGALELGWDVEFLRAKDSMPADILRAAKGCDLLLWMRTHDYNIKGGDGRLMLRRVEDLGVATAGIHFDLYWGIASRQQRVGREAWWSAQHVFTADGGPRAWASRGVNHHWCPPPFGSRFLGYGVRRRHLERPAVFVGSNISGIHSSHRTHMITWATRQFGRYGFAQIGRAPKNRVYGRDLNDLYASVDLVLGDSVLSPWYWSDRLPRTLGRGALLAYPKTQGMDEWGFTDDVMITFTAENFSEILAKKRLVTPARRQEMTDAAITLIRDRHLWRHRLEHIAGVVLHGTGDYRGGRAAAEMERVPRRSVPPRARRRRAAPR